VTNICDAAGTAEVSPDRVVPVILQVEWNGRRYEHVTNGIMLAPAALMSERSLLGVRLESRAPTAPRTPQPHHREPPEAWLGFVAAGKAYYDLRQV